MCRFIFAQKMDQPARWVRSVDEIVRSSEIRIESGFRYYFTCQKESSPVKIGQALFPYSLVCHRFPMEGGRGEETIVGYCSRRIMM